MAAQLLSREELMEMASAVPADPVVPGRPVTEKMRLGDIIAAHPAAAAVVSRYGLHCSGCHANVLDTLEMGARGHGLGDVEIRAMVLEINQVAQGKTPAPAPADGHAAKASEFCSIIGNPGTVNLTDGAAAHLRALLERRRRARYGIRIGIHNEGPAGYIYYLDLERKPKRGDVVLKERGLKFFVDSSIERLIRGLHVDYESGFEGDGLRFTNPNLSNSDFLRRRAEAPPPLPAETDGPAGPAPARGREVEQVPADFAAQRYRNPGL